MPTKTKDVLEKARKIKLVISAVDGVLTDAKIYFNNSGEESKAFNSRDGFGIRLLHMANIRVAVITIRQSPMVKKHMADLDVGYVMQAKEHKLEAYQELKSRLNLEDEQIAVIGDDVPDVGMIKRAGLGVAVADAPQHVVQFSDWQTTAKGGQGAMRELSELVLQAQNQLDSLYESFL